MKSNSHAILQGMGVGWVTFSTSLGKSGIGGGGLGVGMSAIPVKEKKKKKKKKHGDMKYNYHAIVRGMITGNGAMLPGMEEGGGGDGGGGEGIAFSIN